MSFNNNTKAFPSNSKASSSRKQMNDNISEDERPCFYKILRDTEQMREIPKEFLKHISKDLSRTSSSTLSIEADGSWIVQLILKEGGLFMDYGWAQFLRDNLLMENMLLSFRYDGNMHFNVQVFKMDGMERSEAPGNRIHTESAGHSNGKRPRGRPRKYRFLEEGPGADHKSEVLKATERGKNVKRESQDRNQSSSKVAKRATSIPDQSRIKVEEGKQMVRNLKMMFKSKTSLF